MQFTVNQIAEMAHGTVEGRGDTIITDIAKIEEGGPGSITFLANPKYEHCVYTSRCSAILVREDFKLEHPVEATLIRVADPYATVAHLLTLVAQFLEPRKSGIEQPCFIAEGVEIPLDAYIGAFAYIGKGAKIGARAQIYPQTYVGDGAEIGDDSILKPGAKVYHGCKIGARCIIHSGAVIGADGFGFAPVDGHYEKIPQIGIVEIADDVEIGANTTIDRATMGATRIHEGVKLDNLIQVAHNCEVGAHTVMAAQAGVAGSTKVGAHCMVGGQVGIAGHISIGDDVQIGAQSGLHTNLRSGSRVIGSPCMPLGDFARVTACLRYLPQMRSQLRDLEKKQS